MVASATYAPYGGLGDYMKLGYVPIDTEPEAASKTVEYAYDDWTIARMARSDGPHRTSPRRFEKRAANWRNSFDAKTGFVRARKANGSFRVPFDPDRDQLRLATIPRAMPGNIRGSCRRTRAG